MRIIGIDPGSRCTGYGIISSEQNQPQWIAHGQITCAHADLTQRLQHIHQALREIIIEYKPQQAAIEQVFVHQNVQSALKLGQARGAAIIALGNIPIAEYSPRQIKQAAVGYGAASKLQVQHMIKSLLQLTQLPPSDAADALAIALCHYHTYTVTYRFQQALKTQDR